MPSCCLKLHCTATTLDHCSNATRAIERKQVRVRDSIYPASSVSSRCRVVFTGVHGEKTTRLRSAMVVSHTFLGWGRNWQAAPDQQTTACARCAFPTLTPGTPAHRCFVALSSCESTPATLPSLCHSVVRGLARVHARTKLQARRLSRLSQRSCSAFQGQQQIAQHLAASKPPQQHARKFFHRRLRVCREASVAAKVSGQAG
jgi:hypothetical protein